MNDRTYSEDAIRRALAVLNHHSKVAFVLSCGERMLPNYRAFVREGGWGSVQALAGALSAGWAWLRGEGLPEDTEALKSACDLATPDTEDFDSILVSPALDAANVAGLLLDLLAREEGETAAEAACLARDTVDMYVQEIAQIPPDAPDLEERIRLHPLMQAEIARQLEDLQLLSAGWSEAALRPRWSSPARGNLGVG